MRTARLPTVHVLVATTRCQYHRRIGPQVNKFERVSDDHLMSVAGGGGNLTYDLFHDVFDVITLLPPPPDRQTPVKTLLPQISFAGGKNIVSV